MKELLVLNKSFLGIQLLDPELFTAAIQNGDFFFLNDAWDSEVIFKSIAMIWICPL
jgi:hypothetical protein